MRPLPDPFETWIERLFERWMGDLSHQEIARALKALTQDYVQRRHRLHGKALAGRGKQAAFACYYGPRHFLVVREVLRALQFAAMGGTPRPPGESPFTIIDLGCGSGVAGAAWALHAGGKVVGVELDRDLLREAAFTFRDLGVRGGGVCCNLNRYRWPKPPVGVVAAFTVNELEPADRERLWLELEKQIKAGGSLLIIEPLASRIAPWWQDWADRVTAIGGRADEWHFDVELPERVHLLGKSAGLNPEKLGAKTLWVR